MSTPNLTIDGRRLYIATQYGDPCVPGLKALGAHWDAASRRWWISSAKQADVEKAIAKTAGQSAISGETRLVGNAKYKGRTYYVQWFGDCKNGERKAHLCSLDGKIDFWAKCEDYPRPGHDSGDVATIVKVYREPTTVGSIQRYIDRLKRGEANGAGPKPDTDCYMGPQGEWLCRGCGECARLGTMCKSCQFDIYDN